MTAVPDQLRPIDAEAIRALKPADLEHTLRALLATHRDLVRSLVMDRDGDSYTFAAQMARRLLIESSVRTEWTIGEMSSPAVWQTL